MHHRRAQGNLQSTYDKKPSDHSVVETVVKRQEKYLLDLEEQRKIAKRLLQKNAYEEVNEKREGGFSAFVNGANRFIRGDLSVPKPKNPSYLGNLYKNKDLFLRKVLIGTPKNPKRPAAASNFSAPQNFGSNGKRKSLTGSDRPLAENCSHPYYASYNFTYRNIVHDIVPAQFSSDGVADEMIAPENKISEPLLNSRCKYSNNFRGGFSGEPEGDSIECGGDANGFRNRKSSKISLLKSKHFNAFLKQFMCCST